MRLTRSTHAPSLVSFPPSPVFLELLELLLLVSLLLPLWSVRGFLSLDLSERPLLLAVDEFEEADFGFGVVLFVVDGVEFVFLEAVTTCFGLPVVVVEGVVDWTYAEVGNANDELFA